MKTNPLLRRSLIGVGVLLLLVVVAGAVLVATFDANRYKGVAIDWMKSQHDRTLTIDGPVRLSVFPRVAIRLSLVKLSEKGRADQFAALGEAGLALELWPLLSKQVVVDRVEAKGVQLRLTRNAKGVWNFDDLLSSPSSKPSASPSPPSGTTPGFDVSAIELQDVQLQLKDEMARLAGELRLKSLTTGRLANGVESPVALDASVNFSEPKLKGDLSGRTRLALNLDKNAVRLSQMQLGWKGEAFGVRDMDVSLDGGLAWDGGALAAQGLAMKLGATLGELKLADSRLDLKAFRYDPKQQLLTLDALKLALAGRQGADPLKLSLDWPQLEASAASLKGSALNGSFALEGPTQLQGTFRSGPPTGNFERLHLPKLALDLNGKTGPRALKAQLTSDLTLQAEKRSASLDGLQLQAQIQEPSLQPLTIQARGQASGSASGAAAKLAGQMNQNRFDIDANAAFGGRVPKVVARADFASLDLNRLLAPPTPAGGSKSPGGPAPTDTPVDLSALNKLDGQFNFKAGDFAFRQYRVADARIEATLNDGVLRIGQFAGRAWNGTVNGTGSAEARSQRVAVKLAANGVNMNALLKDVANKDLLEGTGRVNADLTTSGKSVGEFRSRLAGTAAMQLRDGAIKGYNLARGLRQAKAALSMKQDAVTKARQTEKTDFSELNASAHIADGVAHSDDLDLKSPFLRIGGAGRFDIGRGTIDYVARATVANTSKGQGGAELAALEGVTVPVQLTGPFEAIDWKIQWSGVAAAAVQNQLRQKLGEKLGLPADGAASGAKPSDSAKDALKQKLRKELFR